MAKDRPDHGFSPIHAEKYGVHSAILIRHFQYWMEFNENRGKNFHEGKTWTYGTLEEISSHFPYLSKRQVEYAINKLVDEKVLIRSNFNKAGYDRTCWYTLDISQNCEMDIRKLGNGYPEIVTPIPDTQTDTKNNNRGGEDLKHDVVVSSQEKEKSEMWNYNDNDARLAILGGLPFTKDFKNTILIMRNSLGMLYTLEELTTAVDITKNSKYDNLHAFFTDILKNPEKYQMLETGGTEEQNKEKIYQLFSSFDMTTSNGLQIIILNKYAEINPGVGQPKIFQYKSKNCVFEMLDYVKKNIPDVYSHLNI